MTANAFGQRFVVTTFGESHGPALGALIDGCPAGVPFDASLLAHQLARRRPGTRSPDGHSLTSSRDEPDAFEILSGIYQGLTLGTPIALLVRNHDARSQDYAQLTAPRPGHADDVWLAKFGHTDPRGGGRSSGRETVARVLAGAIAQMFVRAAAPSACVAAFATHIGPLSLTPDDLQQLSARPIDHWNIDAFAARFPSPSQQSAVTDLLASAKHEGKSYGGQVELSLSGVPMGLGQPVFHKLKADLAAACLSVGATASCEIGDGHQASQSEGSQFHQAQHAPSRYGGIRGGISTGEPVLIRVGFKPTASVLDVAKRGRHDPCIIPRAIPVLEAMAWLVLADHLLWMRTDRLPAL